MLKNKIVFYGTVTLEASEIVLCSKIKKKAKAIKCLSICLSI